MISTNKRPEKKLREIEIGSPGGLPRNLDPKIAKKIGFVSNQISTTKYTKWTFLPKALAYQFLRFANIYFLTTAIIQSIPYVSPLHPFSAIAPFVFVLTVSMAREGIEDLQRFKDDNVTNNKKCKVLRDGDWAETKWKDVQVADYVRITSDEKFPCDLIVMTTSLKSENRGTCYIETATLDGERNLKPRLAIAEIMDYIDEDEEQMLMQMTGKINCQQPNADLHDFDGVIEFNEQKYSLSSKQLLLRGASLKNTQYAIGLVVYTGHDTKVMKNSENSRYKISKMEMLMNDLILKLLILQALLYVGSVVGFIGWNQAEKDKYIHIPENDLILVFESMLMILTYFILYNTLLPISLIVTIEIVKVVQSYFISKDFSFWNEEQKTGCKVMTRSINEELGQVQYVFSDKTGTLTRNVMELKYLTIGNSTYEGKLENEEEKGVSKYALKGGYFSKDLEKTMDMSNTQNWGSALTVTSLDKSDSYSIENDSQLLDDFFILMSTCHDCVVEVKKDTPDVINYEGPSPDEICLVSAARQHGYVFLGTTSNTTVVDVKDTKTELELVSLFQFDNKRKMMSVLVKHNNKYKLLSKGADSAILSRLAPGEQPYLSLMESKLQEYSKQGLRTLCMGVKVLSDEELQSIKEEILNIDSSENKKELLPIFLEKIESNFTLIGCSAVEDRLQDKVPEVIASLLEADIKVWMLTGDKMETAENIGLSCNLVSSDFEIIRLKQYTEEKVQNYLGTYQEKINIARQKRKKVCTVIDGKCLGVILKTKERAIQYLNLMKECESVICCRATPMQKADVVRLVKKNLGKTSLAIGDGANDVNMIQEGDIGVGLFGLEGRQAANASDFAVPEFKALYKLLFVHGRWSYLRNSEMILYFFYKNMLFTIPQLFFIFLNAYSGLSLFDDWYMTFYNMSFTAAPLMAKAILEQDTHYGRFESRKGKLVYREIPVIRKLMPYLYRFGQNDTIFNNKTFLLCILEGILQGFGIWFVSTYSLEYSVVNIDGHTSDFWFKSITMFTSIVLIATLKLSLITRYWTWINFLGVTFLGSFIYFAYIWITDSWDDLPPSRTQKILWTSWLFYLVNILNIGWFVVWEIGSTVISNLIYVGHDVLIKVMERTGKFESMEDEDIVRIFSRKKIGYNKVADHSRAI